MDKILIFDNRSIRKVVKLAESNNFNALRKNLLIAIKIYNGKWPLESYFSNFSLCVVVLWFPRGNRTGADNSLNRLLLIHAEIFKIPDKGNVGSSALPAAFRRLSSVANCSIDCYCSRVLVLPYRPAARPESTGVSFVAQTTCVLLVFSRSGIFKNLKARVRVYKYKMYDSAKRRYEGINV